MTAVAEQTHLTPEYLVGAELYEQVQDSMYALYNLRPFARDEFVCDPSLLVREPMFRDALPTTPLTERYDVGGDTARVFEKNEATRETGSFKEQGAFWASWNAFQENPQTRVFAAYSAGNHAAGVNKFVKYLNEGIAMGFIPRPEGVSQEEWYKPATMHAFCKTTASAEKTEKLDKNGAHVNQHDEFGLEIESLDTAKKVAERFVDRSEVPTALIPPYANAHVMAGQANVLLSTVMQLREAGMDLRAKPTVLYVGAGGNGLANGTAVALDQLVEMGVMHPASHVVACQMENCDGSRRGVERLDQGNSDMTNLFVNADGINEFDGSADGTAVEVPDLGNLLLAQHLLDKGRMRFMTVTKAETGRDMERAAVLGVQEEPAAALAGAALRKDLKRSTWEEPFDGYAVHVVSGGNASESTRVEFAEAAKSLPHRLGQVAAQETVPASSGKKLQRNGVEFVMSTAVLAGSIRRTWVAPPRTQSVAKR